MTDWFALHPDVTPEHLGFIPGWLDEADPDPAAKQIDKNYAHGGGWRHFDGFDFNRVSRALTYPGDPPMLPLAMTSLRDETIFFYEFSWLLIMQKDGSFEVARID